MEERDQKTILIVDDEQEVLTALAHVLKRANYKVVASSKGAEVLGLSRQFRPDAIILDIIMPDLSGDEVAAQLLEDEATAKIPIIFLTGIITKEEEYRRGNLGKQFVVAKPVTPEKIVAMVKSALQANPA